MVKEISVLPADTYTVVNQTILTEVDKKIIINLYEPIIGPTAVSLYLTLWSDLDKYELISKDYNHHHLMTILKSSLEIITNARRALEAVGLLKSFRKVNDGINEYLYELFSPLPAHDFFNHPILSVLLLNNIGGTEYEDIKKYYKKLNISKTGFEEITSSINETFRSVTPYEASTDEIRKEQNIGVNLDNLIDFELILSSLPKALVNAKTLNKKTRELINQLAFVYNIDTLKMIEIIRLSITDDGIIDKDKLKINTRKNYEYNHNGSLPTLVYRSQPDHLKTPPGDLSNRGRMIQVFENTKPYDFLKSKNRGVKPTARELKMLERLATDFNLPSGVINVLIDYSIKVNDGKLSQNYLEAIATTWARKNIKTVPEAMETLSKNHKKVVKEVKNENPKQAKVIEVPAWMNQEITQEKMSQEELEELENLYQEFR